VGRLDAAQTNLQTAPGWLVSFAAPIPKTSRTVPIPHGGTNAVRGLLGLQKVKVCHDLDDLLATTSLNKNREFPRLFSYSQLGPTRLGRQQQASEMVLEPQAGCLAEAALLSATESSAI
jgi:hypothetical protein